MRKVIIENSSWRGLSTDQFFEIVRLRYAVYALEQRVAAEDFDELDRAPTTEHWWLREIPQHPRARSTGSPKIGTELSGYLRLLTASEDEPMPPGLPPANLIVGRMAVRQDRRRRGLAQRLLRAAIAAHPESAFLLHAQDYAQTLYRKVGFETFGSPFTEAGIPHVRMYRGPRTQ